jgi:threonine dehydratase
VAGIAAWYAGRIKVIGVEPKASPTLTRAFEAGHPVDAEVGGLAADSLAPRRVGERVFPIVQKYAPQTVLVSDDAIAEAQKTLWRALRIVAEPGGACAFSAITSGAYRPAAGERVAVVISGGNTTAVNFDVTR